MDYWQHQTNKALFPDVIWSRPETASGAGKLLVIGGSVGNMARVARAYSEAENAGAGIIFLLVPDGLAKVTKMIPNIQYAPSNPSGSFARTALAELLSASQVADGVLLAGDLGKNSETTLLLESYLQKYTDLLVISTEAIESFPARYGLFLSRPKTILYLTQNQLRELVIQLSLATPVTSDIGKPQIAEILHEITNKYPVIINVEVAGSIWVAFNGLVTDSASAKHSSAKAAVWAMQQPEKLYKALVSSVIA